MERMKNRERERDEEKRARESKREPITRILIIGHISNAYKFRTNFKPLIEYANDDDRQQHTYTYHPSKANQTKPYAYLHTVN